MNQPTRQASQQAGEGEAGLAVHLLGAVVQPGRLGLLLHHHQPY